MMTMMKDDDTESNGLASAAMARRRSPSPPPLHTPSTTPSTPSTRSALLSLRGVAVVVVLSSVLLCAGLLDKLNRSADKVSIRDVYRREEEEQRTSVGVDVHGHGCCPHEKDAVVERMKCSNASIIVGRDAEEERKLLAADLKHAYRDSSTSFGFDPIWQTHRYLIELVFGAEEIAKSICDGTFVDVGAGDGWKLSATSFFEQRLGWRGVCVEAREDYVAEIKRNRPACVVRQAAVRYHRHHELEGDRNEEALRRPRGEMMQSSTQNAKYEWLTNMEPFDSQMMWLEGIRTSMPAVDAMLLDKLNGRAETPNGQPSELRSATVPIVDLRAVLGDPLLARRNNKGVVDVNLLSLKGDSATLDVLRSIHPLELVAKVRVIHMHMRMHMFNDFDEVVPYLTRIGFEIMRQHNQHAVFKRRDDWAAIAFAIKFDGADKMYGFDMQRDVLDKLEGATGRIYHAQEVEGLGDFRGKRDQPDTTYYGRGCHVKHGERDVQFKCTITSEHDGYDTAQSVFMHARHFWGWHEDSKPRPKLEGQSWNYYSNESPLNDQRNLKQEYVDQFEFKATIGRASDSWRPTSVHSPGAWQLLWLNELVRRRHENHAEEIAKIRARSDLTLEQQDDMVMDLTMGEPISARHSQVIWVSSNCARMDPPGTVHNARTELVEALSKLVPFVSKGPCMPTDPNDLWPKNSDLIKDHHMDRYKFYLSFDNTICYDHVSEKTWRTLIYAMVPVALSAPNINTLMPNHDTLINVRDYTSIKDLAAYINKVNGDDRLLRRHLRHWADPERTWSNAAVAQMDRSRSTTEPYECELCKKIILGRRNKRLMHDNWCVRREDAIATTLALIDNN
eukprot:TRINITY_DN62971_c0_g3_i2.p1 TRINITY_DN62971_c0_g3~~TRINITY_DN62971_c0_g3_i2.p1  ORF type:complete len:845 (+),score=398.36 TRINITY_DN62971_c0_g3_i2:21-2555(+)